MQHKLSWLGYLVSALIIAGAYYRWIIDFFDPSNAVIFIGFGMTIGILSYLWSWMKNKDDEINKLEKRLNTLVAWEFKADQEHIKEEIKGNFDN